MGSSALSAMTAASGRSSVLNPFISPNPGFSTMNNKTLDGRKSVQPFIGGGNRSGSRRREEPQYRDTRDFIQEMVEDEDVSSMASKNRIS